MEGHVRERGGLDAVGAEVFGGEGSVEVRRRLRRLPAQIAHRRRGVGNPFEGADFAVGGKNAVDLALRGFYFERIGVGARGESEEKERQG
jgi:hypothetical protein